MTVFPPISQIMIEILRLQHSVITVVILGMGSHLRAIPGYKCGVVGHRARVCPNQSHDYYTYEPRRQTSDRNTSVRIVENHVDSPCSTEFNKRPLFFSESILSNEVPLYRECKLQIPTKTMECIEVKENSLLTAIVNIFDEDIGPNSSFETF